MTIVYESNAGHTKAYAEMLAKKTGLPVYTRKEAFGGAAKKGEEIIYMSWLFGDRIQKLKSVMKRYNVKALCPVGMGDPELRDLNDLRVKNALSDDLPMFLLYGGLEIQKLTGFYALIMKSVAKTVASSAQQKPELTDAEKDALDIFKNGRNCVDEKYLNGITEWLNSGNA